MKKIITAVFAAVMTMTTAASISASAAIIDELPKTSTAVCETKKPLKNLRKMSPPAIVDYVVDEYGITGYDYKYVLYFVKSFSNKKEVIEKVRYGIDYKRSNYWNWNEGMYRFMVDYWDQLINL